MGGKRIGTRQHIYISIACVIAVSLAGCAALVDVKSKTEPNEHLATAERLLEHGDYEGALKENQKVLAVRDDVEPADEALFNIGIIYAHHGYPKRNYDKSLDYFKKLVRTFPHSPRAGQTKVWIGVLQDHERLNKEVEELNLIIKKSKQIDIELEGKKKEFSK